MMDVNQSWITKRSALSGILSIIGANQYVTTLAPEMIAELFVVQTLSDLLSVRVASSVLPSSMNRLVRETLSFMAVNWTINAMLTGSHSAADKTATAMMYDAIAAIFVDEEWEPPGGDNDDAD